MKALRYGLLSCVLSFAGCMDPGSVAAPPPLPPVRHHAPSRAVPSVVVTDALLDGQSAMVAGKLKELRPQRRGHIDLYSVGFAGDGSERVFRNEVEFLAQLMATRFDAAGHVLSLVNSPQTTSRLPMATLDNLRESLAGVARQMDVEEDVLLLFLTSHGSREHEFVVEMEPLALEYIRPRELRKALDDAGIRWRVVVVSACYSGGFIDALRDPRTLVITSARHDRTSFGCGSESSITWFGDAYLAGALNDTIDFEEAFRMAKADIRQWEREERETASRPQLVAGSEIGAKLEAWRQSTYPGPQVPFTGR